MSKEMLEMVMNRIEEAGMKFGTEAIELLQQYYPIARHRVLTGNLMWLAGGLIVLIIGIICFNKRKNANEQNKKEGFAIFGVGGIGFGLIITLNSIYHLLNIDYFTIQPIIDQMEGLK